MELLGEARRAEQRPVTADEVLLSEQLARQLVCEQDSHESVGKGRQLILRKKNLSKKKAAPIESLQDHQFELLRVLLGLH